MFAPLQSNVLMHSDKNIVFCRLAAADSSSSDGTSLRMKSVSYNSFFIILFLKTVLKRCADYLVVRNILLNTHTHNRVARISRVIYLFSVIMQRSISHISFAEERILCQGAFP